MPGKLIVFEGTDGAGLSTQSALLYKYLKKRGHAVIHTKEPTNDYIGKVIRSVLRRKKRFCAETLQLLFCADRAEHIESVIKPALKQNKTVICDRYIMSTVAYGALKLDMKWLISLNAKFRRPDMTILLDVPPEVGLKRKFGPGNEDRFEKEALDFHSKVRDGYLALAAQEPDRWLVIDGTQSKEDIAEIIWQKVRQVIREKIERNGA